jgi:glutaconate CoA-transferase subunit A
MANSGFTQVARRMKKAIQEGTILFEDYSLDAHSMQFHAAEPTALRPVATRL